MFVLNTRENLTIIRWLSWLTPVLFIASLFLPTAYYRGGWFQEGRINEPMSGAFLCFVTFFFALSAIFQTVSLFRDGYALEWLQYMAYTTGNIMLLCSPIILMRVRKWHLLAIYLIVMLICGAFAIKGANDEFRTEDLAIGYYLWLAAHATLILALGLSAVVRASEKLGGVSNYK